MSDAGAAAGGCRRCSLSLSLSRSPSLSPKVCILLLSLAALRACIRSADDVFAAVQHAPVLARPVCDAARTHARCIGQTTMNLNILW